MDIIQADKTMAARLAPLAAAFRVTLRSFKGIVSEADVTEGQEEIEGFLAAGFPIFAAEEAGELLGYLVCRVEDSVVWVEQLFVRSDCRRKGIASRLFDRAETLARSLGEETVYNFVHPNNDAVIAFLRAKGYTVLNLLEIRKPYPGERPNTTVTVDDKSFDY